MLLWHRTNSTTTGGIQTQTIYKVPNLGRSSGRETLAACAQTCRAFSDLALVELWRILNNHVRLFKLLPRTTTEDRQLNTLPVRISLHPFIDHLLTET